MSGSQRYKVVIRFVDHAIRGYVSSLDIGSVEQMVRTGEGSGMQVIPLSPVEGGPRRDVSITDAKAVFFVTTFDGDTRHEALHFHQHAPILPGLWVRVQFQDGEIIEGLIGNSPEHVLGSGFFLTPTDPDGNNRLVYVVKSRLKGFSVLGIRSAIRLPSL